MRPAETERIKMKTRIALPLVAALLAMSMIACSVKVQHTMLDDTSLPPVSAEEVMVFFAGEETPEHTRVAVLFSSGAKRRTTTKGMFEKLREEAGKLGANAVVVNETREDSRRLIPTGRRKTEAIAILIHAKN